MRDILKGEDKQIEMAAAMIARVDPDILLMLNFDYDAGLAAAGAFLGVLRQQGLDMPFAFAFRPNSGTQTALDVNGDGYFGDAEDAQGYGAFSGQGGMLVLSKYRIRSDMARNYSAWLWKDVPENIQSDHAALAEVQKLSSVGHWQVPVHLPGGGLLALLAWHAGTPAFDQGGDRNDRRNRDENLFWEHYLTGLITDDAPTARFVLMGSANLDPVDGEGIRPAIARLLTHRALQDPRPSSMGAVEASKLQGGANLTQYGDAALDTADWRDVGGPGNLRVQYVLPSADLNVVDAGVFWPASNEPDFHLVSGRDPARSWHGIVWVDLIP